MELQTKIPVQKSPKTKINYSSKEGHTVAQKSHPPIPHTKRRAPIGISASIETGRRSGGRSTLRLCVHPGCERTTPVMLHVCFGEDVRSFEGKIVKKNKVIIPQQPTTNRGTMRDGRRGGQWRGARPSDATNYTSTISVAAPTLRHDTRHRRANAELEICKVVCDQTAVFVMFFRLEMDPRLLFFALCSRSPFRERHLPRGSMVRTHDKRESEARWTLSSLAAAVLVVWWVCGAFRVKLWGDCRRGWVSLHWVCCFEKLDIVAQTEPLVLWDQIEGALWAGSGQRVEAKEGGRRVKRGATRLAGIPVPERERES